MVLALALLLLAAPRAGSDPMPGSPAGLGRDIDGLAFDGGGSLYVADLQGDRVVVLGPAGGVAGVIGAGVLKQPVGVALAPGGDVLVADRGGVHRFAPNGAPAAAWPVDDAAGIAAGADGTVYVSQAHAVARFTGAGVPLGGFAADAPHGIAMAGDGTLWVAVAGGLAHVTAAGLPLGTTPADHARGVAAAPDGTVLVAERERDRVTRVAPNGTPVATIEDDFDEPRGVAVDCRGNVAVADDSPARIHRIPAAGAPPPPCTAVAGVVPARPIARRLVVTPDPAPALCRRSGARRSPRSRPAASSRGCPARAASWPCRRGCCCLSALGSTRGAAVSGSGSPPGPPTSTGSGRSSAATSPRASSRSASDAGRALSSCASQSRARGAAPAPTASSPTYAGASARAPSPPRRRRSARGG